MKRTRDFTLLICMVLGGLGAASTSVQAVTKPTVAVRFELKEGRKYRKEFGAACTDLETRAASRIATALSSRIRFLDFSPSATGTAATLAFSLDDLDPSSTATLQEVGFHVTLSGVTTKLYWRFRSAEAYMKRVGTLEALVEEIGQNIESREGADLVDALLSKISIADEARMVQAPPLELGWIIPYKQEDLCMDRESVLVLDYDLPSALTSIPQSYEAKVIQPSLQPESGSPFESSRGQILCEARKGQEHVESLTQPQGHSPTLKAVRVQKYLRSGDSCGGAIPPAEASSGGTP